MFGPIRLAAARAAWHVRGEQHAELMTQGGDRTRDVALRAATDRVACNPRVRQVLGGEWSFFESWGGGH